MVGQISVGPVAEGAADDVLRHCLSTCATMTLAQLVASTGLPPLVAGRTLRRMGADNQGGSDDAFRMFEVGSVRFETAIRLTLADPSDTYRP